MKLTDEHLMTVRSYLASGYSNRRIAEMFGCDPTTVKKFVGKHAETLGPEIESGKRHQAQAKPKAKLTDPLGEMDLLVAELAEYKASARKDRKLDVQAERLLAEIREITPSAEPRYEAPEIAEGEGHRHVHVLLLSDTHIGEVVDAEAMNGLGEYDFEIMCSRLQQITSSLVSFQNNRPYPIDELRIWSLGDITGGKHHQELAETNEFGLAQQAWRGGIVLGQFVEGLVPHYPRIHITGIAGNHARMNDKAQSKQVFDSFDWLANKTSELYLAKYPTVTHDYPLAGMTIDRVAGKTVLLWHGDGVRSSMPGVPWGGLMRRFNQLRTTYAQLGDHLDYLAVGHFHQTNVVKGIFMNGSVKGPDEYILKQYGTADPWEQLLLTFDKDAKRLTDVSYINGG